MPLSQKAFGESYPMSFFLFIVPSHNYKKRHARSHSLQPSIRNGPTNQSLQTLGKTTSGSPFEPGKGKGKGKAKGTGTGKKGKKPIFQVIALEHPTPSADSGSTNQELLRPLPIIHEIDEFDHGEDLAPKGKRARPEVILKPTPGTSSHSQAWNLELLFEMGSILVQDTILDNVEIEISAKVAHGLSRAACLPEDMKVWDPMHSG
jgi:hypothetical protein